MRMYIGHKVLSQNFHLQVQ
uniref:Uncharacterized protein n=1 Tax=Rhizophora mucronata TaxID=61149 RepID=A0A2P2NE14_RHIMU